MTLLTDSNCELVLRDANLEDAGEITQFIAFTSLLKLNDVSSWQLDMQTSNFRSYGIDETMGIMFKRGGELILDGPIMKITQSLTDGQEKTTIYGGCDLALLSPRICYPVVTGPIFDTSLPGTGTIINAGTGVSTPPPASGAWRFGVKRSAIGITTTTTKDAVFDTSTTDTSLPAVLTVVSAVGFVDGNTCTVVNIDGSMHPRTIVGVDLSSNTITVDSGDVVPWPAGCTVIETSGDIVDDPAYLGYDTRTGVAENIAKEIVYYNAGAGSCVDSFGSRAIPFLVVAASAGRGAQITANSRGEFVLDQVQNVCISGGLNFAIKQVGQQLVFDTFYGNDLSVNDNLVFSYDGGNLKEYDYTYGPPIANFVMGAGPQGGVDKIMLSSGDLTSISQYGRREEWINSGTAQAGDTNTQIATNMVQANNLALAQSLINASLTLSIQENDQVQYPQDFQLGDKVGVIIGDTRINLVIGGISYSIPAGTGSAQGSAVTAVLSKTMTKSMESQVGMSKLIQQMSMS